MKPNNLYYRDILTILEPSQEYAKFYSTMYYLRRIAMHYGASYTGRKCSNKYIKDWAIAVGVTDDGQHHVNYYWIKRIAKKLVPSTADDLSENTYLRIISENITPTPVPIATTIKTFINNVEVDNTQTIPPTILSYADREHAVFKFVVTDEEDNPVEGYSIPFSVGGVDQTPMTTNADGEATYTYESSGVGDTNISINCTLVSKTYSITDIYLYDELTSAKHTWTKIDNNTTYSFTENGLVTQGSTGGCYLKLDETLPTDCSIEFTIKGFQSTGNGLNGGFGIDNSWIEPHTTNLQFAYMGGSITTISQVLTANDVVKIIRQGTTYTYYVNDELKYTKNGKATGKYEYFFVRNVANSGVTFKDLKIREL